MCFLAATPERGTTPGAQAMNVAAGIGFPLPVHACLGGSNPLLTKELLEAHHLLIVTYLHGHLDELVFLYPFYHPSFQWLY